MRLQVWLVVCGACVSLMMPVSAAWAQPVGQERYVNGTVGWAERVSDGLWWIRVRNDNDEWVRITGGSIYDCVEVGLGCGSTAVYNLGPGQTGQIASVTRSTCTNPSDDPGYCDRRPLTSFRFTYQIQVLSTPSPRPAPTPPSSAGPSPGGTRPPVAQPAPRPVPAPAPVPTPRPTPRPTARVTIGTKSVNFSPTTVGSTAPEYFLTVWNNGDIDAQISGAIDGGGGQFGFGLTGRLPQTIAPGQRLLVALVFAARQEGSDSAVLTIRANPGAIDSTITLNGSGVARPAPSPARPTTPPATAAPGPQPPAAPAVPSPTPAPDPAAAVAATVASANAQAASTAQLVAATAETAMNIVSIFRNAHGAPGSKSRLMHDGREAIKDRKWDKALGAFSTVLPILSEDDSLLRRDAWVGIGIALTETGRIQEADGAFRQVDHLSYPEHHAAFAKVLHLERRWIEANYHVADAMRSYEHAVNDKSNGKGAIKEAQASLDALRALQDQIVTSYLADAAAVGTPCPAQVPPAAPAFSPSWPCREMGKVLLRRNAWTQAEAVLADALEPELLGDALAGQQRWKEAAGQYQEAAGRNQSLARANVGSGADDLARVLPKRDAALRASGTDPVAYAAAIAAADARWPDCRNRDSVARVQACTAIIDTQVLPDRLRAEALTNRGSAFRGDQTAAAMRDFDEALRLDPRNQVAWYQRGTAREFAGDHAGAVEDLTEAVRLDPEDYLARGYRGDAYLGLREYQKALDDYNAVLRLHTDDDMALVGRGIAFLLTGRKTSALTDFERVMNSTYTLVRVKALYGRGVIRKASGDPAGEADLAAARRQVSYADTMMRELGVTP